MTKYLLSLIVILAAVLFISIRTCNGEREERKRFESNQRELLSDVEVWRTKAGHSAATVQRLKITEKELRNSNLKVAAIADELNIKLKRIQSVSTTSVVTKFVASAPIHDTIFIRSDSVKVYAKTFNWNDHWARVNGMIARDSVTCDVQSYDTLTQIVHRVPRKFLFIRYGTKAIEQTMLSSNPHSNISYTRYIELK